MNHQAHLNADKTFEGVTPEIGGVLGLPTEGYMTKRVTFEKFQELMITYAVKKYTEAASTEISEAIRDLKDPVNLYVTNKMPKIDAKIEKDSVEEMILKEEVREFVRVKNMVISSVNKLFALIWGQCTDGLQSILKMDVEYEEKSKEFDGIWLLRAVKKILAGVSNFKNAAVLVREKMMKLLTTKQYPDETIYQYMTRFKTNHSALEQVAGANILVYEQLMGVTWSDIYNNYDSSSREKKCKLGKETFMAACLVMGSNDSQFWQLKKNWRQRKT